MDSSKKEVWYVFSSTGYPIVNLVPLAMVGYQNISHILVLVGTGAGETDSRHAKRSLDDFKDVLKHEKMAGHLLDDKHLVSMGGDFNDLLLWQDQIQDFVKDKNPDGIIFNIKGGSKEMSIGTMLGLLELKKDATFPVRFVSKAAKDILWLFEENKKEDIPVDHNVVGLNAYLRSYGYTISDPDGQKKKENQAHDRKQITLDLGELVFQGDNQNWIDERLSLLTAINQVNLNESGGQLLSQHGINLLPPVGKKASSSLKKQRRESMKRQTDFLWDVFNIFIQNRRGDIFNHLDDTALFLTKFNGQTWDQTPFVKFFNGEWFEEWIWLKCQEIAKESKASVRLGIKVEDSQSTAGILEHDLDVSLYLGTQLHIIECKSGRGVNTKLQGELDRLSTIHKSLVGDYGRAWLCRAKGVKKDSQTFEKAKKAGLKLISGKKQVNQMFEEVRKIVS